MDVLLRFGELWGEFLGEVGKEIVVESKGYALEEGGVDGGLAIDVVHVGAVANNFVCEPFGFPFLTVHLLLDELTNVCHVVVLFVY